MNKLAQLITQSDLPRELPQNALTSGDLRTVLQIVFGFAGGIALLVVTIAGFKYVISQGDPSSTAKAKNTILYALIGLAVSIMAYAIVTFVLDRI